MRLTRPQERLLTELRLADAPCFDKAKDVYSSSISDATVSGDERIKGNQWPTLLALHDRGLVTFGVSYSTRPLTYITITDDGLDVLAALN